MAFHLNAYVPVVGQWMRINSFLSQALRHVKDGCMCVCVCVIYLFAAVYQA